MARLVVNARVALLALSLLTSSLLLVPATQAGVQDGPRLVRDINSATTESSGPAEVTSLDGTVVFAADGGGGDVELWRSNGTAEGTALVEDINPHGSSNPQGLVRFGESVFFQALGPQGWGLWRTDGTAEGTSLVKVLAPTGSLPPSDDGRPNTGVVAGGRLFFFSRTGSTVTLWKSDGTGPGTSAVLQLPACVYFLTEVPFIFYPSQLRALGDSVYFRRPDGFECHAFLWTSDGTPGGTSVLDLHADGSDDVTSLTVVGQTLYFVSPATNFGGPELWRSDGTEMGTAPVPGTDVDPADLLAFGDRLFFSGNDADHGRELWSTGGTPQGTSVIDVRPGFLGTDPVPLGGAGPDLLFLADDGTGTGLWKTDGTGAQRIEDVEQPRYERSAALGTVGGSIVFLASNDQSGPDAVARLWASDGSADGTSQLGEFGNTTPSRFLFPASAGPTAHGLVVSPGPEPVHGAEPWRTDGTPEGTDLVADIDTDTPQGADAIVGNLAGRVFFGGMPDGPPDSLWRSAGTSSTTRPVSPVSLEDQRLPRVDRIVSATQGSHLFFLDRVRDVWRTDGSPSGTVRIARRDLEAELCPFHGMVAFPTVEPRRRSSLWTTDGTAGGTTSFSVPGRIRSLTVAGGHLFFVIDGGRGGLWMTDGTPSGTVQIEPRSGPDLAGIGRRLFFGGPRPGGQGLWSTDGSAGGSTLVARLPAAPLQLVAVGSTLYFRVRQGPHALGLWASDGTPAGTHEVGRFRSQRRVSSVTNMSSALGRLFFLVGDRRGHDLWVSDGTRAGTTMLREDASLSGHPAGRGRLYFASTDADHGRELWSTDGTAGGTTMVADIRPGPASSDPDGFEVVGRKLYFLTDDAAHGRELWAYGLP